MINDAHGGYGVVRISRDLRPVTLGTLAVDAAASRGGRIYCTCNMSVRVFVFLIYCLVAFGLLPHRCAPLADLLTDSSTFSTLSVVFALHSPKTLLDKMDQSSNKSNVLLLSLGDEFGQSDFRIQTISLPLSRRGADTTAR